MITDRIEHTKEMINNLDMLTYELRQEQIENEDLTLQEAQKLASSARLHLLRYLDNLQQAE